MSQQPNKFNRHVTLVSACLIGSMAFAWINVPYYKLVCQKLGIGVADAANVISDPAAPAVAGASAVGEGRAVRMTTAGRSGFVGSSTNDESAGPRVVQINLMGVVGEGLPVDFYPLQHTLQVQPGKSAKTMWRFTNLSDKSLEIQAVHNVAPAQAEAMLRKQVCFCFTKQTLAPHETKEMPVVFTLDPKLDQDTRVVTLGYTLFNLHPEHPELLPSEQKALQQHHHHSA